MRHKVLSHANVLKGSSLLLGVVVFGLTVAIRIRLLGVPLERDQGEYSYATEISISSYHVASFAFHASCFAKAVPTSDLSGSPNWILDLRRAVALLASS